MMDKLRNSLMVSAIAICGVVAGHSGAMADPVTSPDISFDGTVTNKCVFGTPTNGTLGDISSPTQDYLRSFSSPGGSRAQIKLTCNGDVQVAISEFTQSAVVDGMTVKSGTVTVSVQGVSGSSYLNWAGRQGAPISVTGPISNKNINIGMQVKYESAVKPGTYTYTTKVTATPQ